MNTDTGQIKAMLELSEDERKSGKWVPVSDDLAAGAERVGLEQAVNDLKARRELEAKVCQLEGLRKEGRR
jgi:hypothetical protein